MKSLATVETAEITPLAMLERAVISGADVAVLERLMALSERWQANQAQRAFAEALSAARGDMPAIIKTKTVDFTSKGGRTHYRYEDLSEMIEQVAPVLARHGLSFRWRTDSETPGYIKVTFILSHGAGHIEETALSGPYDVSGNKNPIQAIGSVTSYLQRYTFKAGVGLAAGVDDDGRQGTPTKGREDAPPSRSPSGWPNEEPISQIGPEMAQKFYELADRQGWPRPHLDNAAKKHYGADLAALTPDQAGELKRHMYDKYPQRAKTETAPTTMPTHTGEDAEAASAEYDSTLFEDGAPAGACRLIGQEVYDSPEEEAAAARADEASLFDDLEGTPHGEAMGEQGYIALRDAAKATGIDEPTLVENIQVEMAQALGVKPSGASKLSVYDCPTEVADIIVAWIDTHTKVAKPTASRKKSS